MDKKPIEISQSSLLSLKAEILKKQQEVQEAKLTARSLSSATVRRTNKTNPGVEERNARDQFNSEIDSDVLKQSRIALEAKTKLYDKLSKTVIDEEDEGLYLVQFNKKPQEYPPPNPFKPLHNTDPDPYDEDNTDIETGDEWMEYTDCLGRSRMCLRKDLPFVKSKDIQLSTFLPLEKQQNVPVIVTEMDEFNVRREQMRQQWEAQEHHLMDKDNIHYQDVLFDEARSHGVGYFNFSHNEDERIKQQQELKKLREETKTKQQQIQELKQKRDAAKAARIHAAKNRQRARLGLPPLEHVEEQTPLEQEPLICDQEQTLKSEEKTDEEKAKEKELEALRSQHIRPWDIGKKEMQRERDRQPKSQEEWVQHRRKERPNEFAPPSMYQDNHHHHHHHLSRKRRTTHETDTDSSEEDHRHNNPDTVQDGREDRENSPSHYRKYYAQRLAPSVSSEGAAANDDHLNNTDNDRELRERSPNYYRNYYAQRLSSASVLDAEDDKNPNQNPLRFTTKKTTKSKWKDFYPDESDANHQPVNPYKRVYNPFTSNFIPTPTPAPAPTPIVNEVDEHADESTTDVLYDPFEAADQQVDDDDETTTSAKEHQNYAKIPPPATMEYYGTSSSSSKSNHHHQHQVNKPFVEIQASIEAGLKFLRKQSERKHAKTENVGFFD